jgi:nicotinamidase-related amidase
VSSAVNYPHLIVFLTLDPELGVLGDDLPQRRRSSLIVIGLRANTCIDSTVRYAAELGYEVTLVSDAIGSYSWDEMKATLE